jgi:hypothetical protein
MKILDIKNVKMDTIDAKNVTLSFSCCLIAFFAGIYFQLYLHLHLLDQPSLGNPEYKQEVQYQQASPYC